MAPAQGWVRAIENSTKVRYFYSHQLCRAIRDVLFSASDQKAYKIVSHYLHKTIATCTRYNEAVLCGFGTSFMDSAAHTQIVNLAPAHRDKLVRSSNKSIVHSISSMHKVWFLNVVIYILCEFVFWTHYSSEVNFLFTIMYSPNSQDSHRHLCSTSEQKCLYVLLPAIPSGNICNQKLSKIKFQWRVVMFHSISRINCIKYSIDSHKLQFHVSASPRFNRNWKYPASSKTQFLTRFFYLPNRKETEMSVLRQIVRVWNKSTCSHPSTSSRYPSSMSFLFTNLYTQQHRASTYSPWTQARDWSEPNATSGNSSRWWRRSSRCKPQSVNSDSKPTSNLMWMKKNNKIWIWKKNQQPPVKRTVQLTFKLFSSIKTYKNFPVDQ